MNIRGLGGNGKVGIIRKMVVDDKISIMSLSETKSSNLIDQMVKRMWGVDDCGWASVEAINSNGGLLIVRDKNFLHEESISKSEC